MSKKVDFLKVQELVNKFKCRLITTIEDYYNNNEKLILEDINGYYYVVSYNNLYEYQLKDFSLRMFDKTNPYTIQNIKLWCKLNNKPFELLSLFYEGNKINLKWKCLEKNCGEIFNASWNKIDRNGGCPYCSGKQVGLSNCLATKNSELAKEWHPTKNGDLTPYDVTHKSSIIVWWKCSKNPKHEWKQKINIRNYNGCPYCAGKLPSEDYNLLVNNPVLCEEWDYIKNDKLPSDFTPNSGYKAWWKCKECGHEWSALINSRNNNIGCPNCSSSKGEKRIKEILNIYNINYDTEFTFIDLKGRGNKNLRFDFCIFENDKIKFLLEYDGIQHFIWFESLMTKEKFKIQQHHDNLKNKYCLTNNIPLIRIPYTEFNNIEQILSKELNITNIAS